jgi:predicted RNA-binding protein with TRAM domain
VTGLFSLTSYQFRIVTVTTTGTGAPSSIVTATTKADVPGAVTGMSAGAISAAGFTVTWLAAADNGGSPISTYVVSSKPAASKIVVTGTSAVLTGVKLGSVYEVKIAAVNAKGTGQTTSAKFLVATVPASPTVTVTRTLSSVTVMWKAAKDTGGSKVASYVTAITPNTIAYTVTSGKAVIANLAPGTRFTFSVSSVNAVGASMPTTVSTGTATAPGVVSALGYATKDAKTLLVTWALPADDGGSKITGYRIRTSIDGAKTWTAWSSVSKSPLTASRPAPGATLQVEISAVNLYGIGTSSGITIKG